MGRRPEVLAYGGRRRLVIFLLPYEFSVANDVDRGPGRGQSLIASRDQFFPRVCRHHHYEHYVRLPSADPSVAARRLLRLRNRDVA